jgi:preprotein translocase subunit YajC
MTPASMTRFEPTGFAAFSVPDVTPLIAMAAPAEGSAPFWVQLVPFAMILGIFYFVILLPMRRRQKKVQAFQDALKTGDRVITTSGIYGTITKVNDTSVQLQIAEKVRIEVAKASVGGYQGQEPVVAESSTGL